MHHWEVLRRVWMTSWVYCWAAICIFGRFCDQVLLLLIKVELVFVWRSGVKRRRANIPTFLCTSHAISNAPLCCKSWWLPCVWCTPLLIWSSSIRVWRLLIRPSRIISDSELSLIKLVGPTCTTSTSVCNHILRLVFNFDRAHPLCQLLVWYIHHFVAF